MDAHAELVELTVEYISAENSTAGIIGTRLLNVNANSYQWQWFKSKQAVLTLDGRNLFVFINIRYNRQGLLWGNYDF